MAQRGTLVGHWLTRGDAGDAAGSAHGGARSIRACPGPDGSPGGALAFDGRESRIVVPDAPDLRLGSGDFTLAVWVRPRVPVHGVPGDVVGKFDTALRCGFTLGLSGSSPAYSGVSDARHVHFEMDDGYCGEWVDCGRPWPSNSLVSALVAFEGRLYAGIADAARARDAAHVFRWAGGRRWIDCGRLGSDPGHLSVMSMLVHDGSLYAGTGVWDWTRASGEGFRPALSRVFRYEGGRSWRDLGQVGESVRVLCLASYRGHLYAGLDRVGGGHVFRLAGDAWEDCGALNGDNVECLCAHGGDLYATTHRRIYRRTEEGGWLEIGNQPYGIAQIHSTQVYGGSLYLGTWPQGYVLRLEGDGEWSIAGRVGLPEGMALISEVNDLTVYNGKLYAGVIPKAQVWRYESDGHWTLLDRLAGRPDWSEQIIDSWGRVPCLTVFQGRLFAGTGACKARARDVDPAGTHGRVLALQAGQCVSHDRDIGGGWTHLAAARRGEELVLYVDGRLAAGSRSEACYPLDLSTPVPLTIGCGPRGYFAGELADLRLYRGALAAEEIKRLGESAVTLSS